MTLKKDLATLDQLPALVAELQDIRAAARALREIGYGGAGALTADLDNALEALNGAPGALLYLEGLRFAKGDPARFERWDAGIAGRVNLGELP